MIRVSCTGLIWNDIIDKFSEMYCGNSIDSIVRRLGLATCVYLIWQERNNRIFRNEKRTCEGLFDIFKETVRMRLMPLKAKSSQAVLSTQKRWNVKFQCLSPLGMTVPTCVSWLFQFGLGRKLVRSGWTEYAEWALYSVSG
ncbi:hypothetical protein Tco_0983005, partial [Tanacetum coccineum]